MAKTQIILQQSASVIDYNPAAKHLRMQIHDGIESAKAAMQNAQQRYKAYADKKTSPLEH